MNGHEIITAAIEADKAQLMNRLHLTSKQSLADSESMRGASRDAALYRYAAACNALDNVYWNDVRGITAECAQFVIALHEAGKVLGLDRATLQAAAQEWESAQ